MAEDKGIGEEMSDLMGEELQKALHPIIFPDTHKVEILNLPEPAIIDFSGLERTFKGVIELKKGDKGDSIKGDKGDSIKGDKGDSPTDEELTALIEPLIPEPIPGKDGEDTSPAMLKKLEDGIEEFKKQIENRIRKALSNIPKGQPSAPSADAVNVHIVSDQCNGDNRRFTMPMARKILKFEMSQHPFNLYPDTSAETHGFTIGDRSIELDSTVPAPQKGQSAAIYYVK